MFVWAIIQIWQETLIVIDVLDLNFFKLLLVSFLSLFLSLCRRPMWLFQSVLQNSAKKKKLKMEGYCSRDICSNTEGMGEKIIICYGRQCLYTRKVN